MRDTAVTAGVWRRDAITADNLAIAIGWLDRQVFPHRPASVCVSERFGDRGQLADYLGSLTLGGDCYTVYAPNLARMIRNSCAFLGAMTRLGYTPTMQERILCAAVHEVRHRLQRTLGDDLRYWDAMMQPVGPLGLALEDARHRDLWKIAVAMDAGNWDGARMNCEELDASTAEFIAFHRLKSMRSVHELTEVVWLEP